MSRAYNAKQVTLKYHPEPSYEAEELFVGYLDFDGDNEEFEYEFGVTPLEYVYGEVGKRFEED